MKVYIYKVENEIEDSFSNSLTLEGLSETEITWLAMLLHKEHVENNSPRAKRFFENLQEAIDKTFLKD
jgi:transcriptional regulatory protein LevR